MGDLLEYLEKALSSWLVQIVLKFGGGFFAAYGVQEASIQNIIIGAVAFIFGLIGQKLQVNTALNTPPPSS